MAKKMTRRQLSRTKNESNLRRGWTRDELLLAFNLYCKIPFGRMHRGNPEIIQLASVIERTPSSVAMKLVNFASLDPAHQQRKVSGLRNASRSDREIFAEFSSDWESLAFESESARVRLLESESSEKEAAIETVEIPQGKTERQQLVRVRTVQGFFRRAVMASYEYRCAICGICIVELLNASHIIPWNANVERRADPTNGLALCSLHDRAFDRGLLAIDDRLRVIIADSLRVNDASKVHRVALVTIEGKLISLPHRFHPDAEALEYHREKVFQQTG